MPSKKPKPSELREAFKTDLTNCWQYARSLHPKETPYAFALHGLEGTPEFYPYVLTEEGLTQVAKRYVTNGYHETVEEARKELRYSMEDSPYCSELDEKFTAVNALMEPIAHELDETEGYDLLAKAAMDAFVALDKQGTFGKGKPREKLALMIDTSFAEKDWSLPSVKKLNPRPTIKRYEADTKVEGDFKSAHDFHLSANGRVLTYKGYREVDPRTGKVFDDLAVCDIEGLRVKPRWCISWRDSDLFFGINCASDGTVFITETKEKDEKYETRLIRYAKGEKSCRSHVDLPGEVNNLTFSPDGRRMAMTMNGKLHFLDEKLQIVSSVPAPKNVQLKQFLKSGDLFGRIVHRLITIDPKGKVTTLPCRDKAIWISFNTEETLCVVSIMSSKSLSESKPKDQFGFKLLTFPRMKLVREFKIPGHQLTNAALSSDGKLVACEAGECGQRKTSVVVFDVKSGREIARRKVDRVDEMAFLPGKHVLVMTTSGNMTGEPILLWKVR